LLGLVSTYPPFDRPTAHHQPPLFFTAQISALFLWSIISFDVTGVHYFSYAPNGGGYRDPVITNAIRTHNLGLRAAKGSGPVSGGVSGGSSNSSSSSSSGSSAGWTGS
jgi:hypothetical protein